MANSIKVNIPQSKLGKIIADKLPKDYLFTKKDQEWLDTVDNFIGKEVDNKNITKAFKKAYKKHGISKHIDPYELAIDSGICDHNLKPL